MWDLYPMVHQSTGEEEDDAVGFRGAGGVCSASSSCAGGGAPEACRVGVQRRRETHRRGDRVAISRRETPARVFLGF
jgi:Na+-transporting NADH:ubiquinone oxidoreductase subunit NqrF